MLRQWNRNNGKTFKFWFSIPDSFMKSFVILFCYVFNDGNYNVYFELNPKFWIVIMVTYCFLWFAMNRIAICLHNVQYDCELWYFTVGIGRTECDAHHGKWMYLRPRQAMPCEEKWVLLWYQSVDRYSRHNDLPRHSIPPKGNKNIKLLVDIVLQKEILIQTLD